VPLVAHYAKFTAFTLFCLESFGLRFSEV